MLSKAQIGLIKSLQHKKFRTQHRLFVVEGIKSVSEFMHSSYKVQQIFLTAEAHTKLDKIPQNIKCEIVPDTAFNKLSSLKNPQGILALVELPAPSGRLHSALLKGRHSIALDDIQDPGNLGTIIRTAEWFGIDHMICSMDRSEEHTSELQSRD